MMMHTQPDGQTSIAQQIADIACDLDWLKRECGTTEQRTTAALHLDTLHRIAESMDAGLYTAPDADEEHGGHRWESVKDGHALPECGDPVTGQPCRNESAAACGECLALIKEAEGVAA